MADNTIKFLDYAGLQTLWTKIKNTFVEKEDGKGLSTNDFTNNLKDKLDDIEAGAQVNTIESFTITTTDGTTTSAASVQPTEGSKAVGVVYETDLTKVGDSTAAWHGVSAVAVKNYVDDVVAEVTGEVKVTVDPGTVEDLVTLSVDATGRNLSLDDSNVKDAIDGINTKIGTVPEGKDVVTMIADAQTAAEGKAAELATAAQTAGEAAAAQALVDAKAYVDPKFEAVDTKIGKKAEGDTPATGLYKEIADAQAAGEAAAADALDAAKTYANGLAGNYEVAGAADQALADAKAYVDGIVNDTTGEDGAVTKGLNSRIADLEAIDHDKLAADASAAAVATVLDGAPEKFDTLKEIAAWIESSDAAAEAADLVTRVSTIETTIGAPASGEGEDAQAATGLYKEIADAQAAAAADATTKANNAQAAAEATAKGYADDAQEAGEAAAAQALTDAKAYTDTEVGKVNTVIGKKADGEAAATGLYADIAAAEQNAKDYADGLADNYEVAGAAATAEQNAKDYADEKIQDNLTDDAAAETVPTSGTFNVVTDVVKIVDGVKTVAPTYYTFEIISDDMINALS